MRPAAISIHAVRRSNVQRYIGVDIVDELIACKQKRYATVAFNSSAQI